jgi:hypothetical protein
MFITDLVIALIIAGVLVAVLGMGLRRQPFGTVLVAMFTILFLATWAGGAWMTPLGPRIWGTAVLSFLVVGLLVALMVTAFIPRQPPRTRGEALRQDDARRQAATFINVFFWLVVVLLVAVILARYW